MSELTKEYWVEKLNLMPHLHGGYYRKTFTAENQITIPGKIETPHCAGTDIYYLLGSPTIGNFSAWHTLNDLEESWHHHYGKDVIIYIIDSKGNFTENYLGIGENAEPQIHIYANSWVCAVLNSENQNDYALVGCTVYPGFDYKYWSLGKKNELSEKFPEHKEIFEKYTRSDQEGLT